MECQENVRHAVELRKGDRAVTTWNQGSCDGSHQWCRSVGEGFSLEIRGWGAGCVPRALEVQDLPICEAEAARGHPSTQMHTQRKGKLGGVQAGEL